jgi:hypothetical protein
VIRASDITELEKNVDIAPANNSMSKRPGTSPHSVIRPNGPTNGSPRHGRSRSPIHAQKRSKSPIRGHDINECINCLQVGHIAHITAPVVFFICYTVFDCVMFHL